MPQLRSALGLLVLLLLAWGLSVDRRRFPFRTLLGGMALQAILALFVLRTGIGADLFVFIGRLVAGVIGATDQAARFVFGNLVDVRNDGWGFVFAAKALPTIIVFSSMSAIGYHLGVLQRVVGAMAFVMTRFMGVSGAESLNAAGNVFLGQTEAPLLVRPYIPRMTDSELNALMIAGFATIAGSLMAVYSVMIGQSHPEAVAQTARHLLTASIMSAPASLVVAKIMMPEKGLPETAGRLRVEHQRTTVNLVDAAATGALDGLKLALNVAGMLIAFLAIIYVVDAMLAWLGGHSFAAPIVRWLGLPKLSIDGLLGLLFYPIAWLIGVADADCRPFASLLGLAMAANEFIAYKSLADMSTAGTLSPRTTHLAMYALCGFANFSSIAIQIAGIGGIAPDRRHDLARLGLRAMFGGAIACWLTACMAGILI